MLSNFANGSSIGAEPAARPFGHLARGLLADQQPCAEVAVEALEALRAAAVAAERTRVLAENSGGALRVAAFPGAGDAEVAAGA